MQLPSRSGCSDGLSAESPLCLSFLLLYLRSLSQLPSLSLRARLHKPKVFKIGSNLNGQLSQIDVYTGCLFFSSKNHFKHTYTHIHDYIWGSLIQWIKTHTYTHTPPTHTQRWGNRCKEELCSANITRGDKEMLSASFFVISMTHSSWITSRRKEPALNRLAWHPDFQPAQMKTAWKAD